MKQVVYAPHSRQADLIQAGVSMQLDSSGTAFAHAMGDDNNPPRKKQKLLSELEDTASSGIGPNTQVCLATDTTQCHKSCSTHRDCDITKDYVCALKGNTELPLHPSWGRFQCVWIANAAVTLVTAAKSRACRSGRCLLEADGDIIMPDPAKDAYIRTGNTSTLNHALVPGSNSSLSTLVHLNSTDELPLNVTLPANSTPSNQTVSATSSNDTLTYSPT